MFSAATIAIDRRFYGASTLVTMPAKRIGLPSGTFELLRYSTIRCLNSTFSLHLVTLTFSKGHTHTDEADGQRQIPRTSYSLVSLNLHPTQRRLALGQYH